MVAHTERTRPLPCIQFVGVTVAMCITFWEFFSDAHSNSEIAGNWDYSPWRVTLVTSTAEMVSCWKNLVQGGHTVCPSCNRWKAYNTTTTTILRPFVWDYLGEPVPEETLTHTPSWSSSLYQLLPSTTIHSILPVQITCLAIFLHNLYPCPLWSTSWSGAFHLIFHTFLQQISVFFLQHMSIPSQPVLL